jgi:hypothetical protein
LNREYRGALKSNPYPRVLCVKNGRFAYIVATGQHDFISR